MLAEFGFDADAINQLIPHYGVIGSPHGHFITLYDYIDYGRKKRQKKIAVRTVSRLQERRKSDGFQPMWFDEGDLDPFWWEEMA